MNTRYLIEKTLAVIASAETEGQKDVARSYAKRACSLITKLAGTDPVYSSWPRIRYHIETFAYERELRGGCSGPVNIMPPMPDPHAEIRRLMREGVS